MLLTEMRKRVATGGDEKNRQNILIDIKAPAVTKLDLDRITIVIEVLGRKKGQDGRWVRVEDIAANLLRPRHDLQSQSLAFIGILWYVSVNGEVDHHSENKFVTLRAS